jgi:phosphoribosylformylglycinamidine synthase subunit PurS
MARAAARLWESEAMRFSVQVEVRLRPGIADPQGSTIERSLPALGFEGIRDVTVGKSIRFTIDATDEGTAQAEVDDLCRRFLANPVIEDSSVTVRAVDLDTVSRP